MEEILNKCPVCGSNLEYHSLYQFSKVYKILKIPTVIWRWKMMGNITYIRKGKFIKSMKNPRRRLAGITSIA